MNYKRYFIQHNSHNRELIKLAKGVIFAFCLSIALTLFGAHGIYAQDALPSVDCPTNLGSCTANDVTTSVIDTVPLASDPTCSSPTDTIDVAITMEYNSTANQRYDLGIFVATDGGSLNGTPAGDPQSTACVGAAAQAGDGDPNSDPSDGDNDLFLDLDPDAGAGGDTCGDLASTAGPVQWTVSATVACDVVGGTLTLGSCRVWEQSVGGNHEACTDLNQAGTGSKCDCTPLTLVGLGFGQIEVIKELLPSGDSGLFTLEIDGVANATDVGDGGTTGQVYVNEGVHTVGESGSLSSYNSVITCVDRGTNTFNGGAPLTVAGSGPLNVDVDIDDDIVCTITNELHTPTPTPTPTPTDTPTPTPTPTDTPTPTPTPTATFTPVPPPSTQGCTPGYWRQKHHYFAWTHYSPSDSYAAVFGVNYSGNLGQAVKANGGGENALARHAVAALLNAANPDVAYPYTTAEVIAMVQAAYASGDFESTKDIFADANEAGCPLGNNKKGGWFDSMMELLGAAKPSTN